jgi:hypothetical protein
MLSKAFSILDFVFGNSVFCRIWITCEVNVVSVDGNPECKFGIPIDLIIPALL